MGERQEYEYKKVYPPEINDPEYMKQLAAEGWEYCDVSQVIGDPYTMYRRPKKKGK